MEIQNKAEKLDKILFNFFMSQWQQKHSFSKMSNLSLKEFFVIQTLGLKKASTTMSELADIFCIPPTTMTSIIDRLIKRKYLTRFRDEDDRRVVKVTLSRKGRNLYDNVYSNSVKSIISLLENLSTSEQDTFIKLFSKILEN